MAAHQAPPSLGLSRQEHWTPPVTREPGRAPPRHAHGDLSSLAWRIPGTEEPGGLPSMRLHRVRHDSSDLAAAAALGSPGATPASLTTACHREGSRVTPLLPSPPHPPPPVSGLDPGCLDGREWGMPGQPPLPSHGQRLPPEAWPHPRQLTAHFHSLSTSGRQASQARSPNRSERRPVST